MQHLKEGAVKPAQHIPPTSSPRSPLHPLLAPRQQLLSRSRTPSARCPLTAEVACCPSQPVCKRMSRSLPRWPSGNHGQVQRRDVALTILLSFSRSLTTCCPSWLAKEGPCSGAAAVLCLAPLNPAGSMQKMTRTHVSNAIQAAEVAPPRHPRFAQTPLA